MYIKIGLSSFLLIPDPQVRDELGDTKSHTFRSGHLSDKAFDMASFMSQDCRKMGGEVAQNSGFPGCSPAADIY